MTTPVHMTNMDCQKEPEEQLPQQQPLEQQQNRHQRIKLSEINSYLTCHLCKGYLIDATTISECLHSFCRSCIIKFLQDKSHCPVCEVIINKAKPNLKLDKTLQDIVYKLVPELFLKEMCRRQAFYRRHPEKASQVSPEQRGEDTERTIFNPHDTFSLSIEYISDDSTPGAIMLPKSTPESGKNGKNGTQKETENMMRRFLQCPGMCRVDVLKKFVRNKYNVDTNRFHIDVLYKRVPLPDHYTLIDIAYIYSWKRNEPMKFFFRITDIKLVKERFDYIEPTINLGPPPTKPSTPTPTLTPQAMQQPTETMKPPIKTQEEYVRSSIETGNTTSQSITNEKKSTEGLLKIKETLKNNVKINGKNRVYTNITLNRSNNMEIITKIQKVSNKNGQPIGLNIIKQTVKKPRSYEKKQDTKKEVKREKTPPKVEATKVLNGAGKENQGEGVANLNKENSKENLADDTKIIAKKELSDKPEVKTKETSDVVSSNVKEETKPVITLKQFTKPELTNSDLDAEKERFLKSIELTARNVLNTIVQTQKKQADATKAGQKRKPASPTSSDKPAKKAKAEKKTPSKRVKITPVKQIEKKAPVENLKTLLNSCKIPSSLSITCVKGDRETQIKPVINHIEILKLPEPKEIKQELDEDKQKLELEKVGTIMKPATSKDEEKTKTDTKEAKSELSITITIENPSDGPKQEKPIGVHPNLPKMLPPVSGTNRAPHSFQKMFEETIRKPEFSNKLEGCGKNKSGEASSNGSNKRNILEIASQLYKKNKLELERNEKANCERVTIPRLNTQKTLMKNSKKETQFHQTVANLHSASLGINYSVSVNQNDQKADGQECRIKSPTVKTEQIGPSKGGSSPKCPISPPAFFCKSPKLPSPKIPLSPHHPAMSPLSPPFTPRPPALSPKPPSTPSLSPKPSTPSPKPPPHTPRQPLPSPKPSSTSQKSHNLSPRLPSSSPKDPKSIPKGSPSASLDPNHLQEKYNIQNLAQISASLNFNPAALGLTPANQLAALQHAMLYKHLEMNRQNWLSMNANPLLQYEKFIQSLNANGQAHLLGNIKEN